MSAFSSTFDDEVVVVVIVVEAVVTTVLLSLTLLLSSLPIVCEHEQILEERNIVMQLANNILFILNAPYSEIDTIILICVFNSYIIFAIAVVNNKVLIYYFIVIITLDNTIRKYPMIVTGVIWMTINQ